MVGDLPTLEKGHPCIDTFISECRITGMAVPKHIEIIGRDPAKDPYHEELFVVALLGISFVQKQIWDLIWKLDPANPDYDAGESFIRGVIRTAIRMANTFNEEHRWDD